MSISEDQTAAVIRPEISLTQKLQTLASRTDHIRDVLRENILNGSLPPGSPLVERHLAESLNISKTPVREALKQLQSTGLVEIKAYQGASVRSLDVELVQQVYTARASIEPIAVQLAVKRLGGVPLLAAREALANSDRHLNEGDVASLSISNRLFHRSLYAMCGNDLLLTFLDQLQDLTAFVASAGWRIRLTAGDEGAEHSSILAAAEKGDADEAMELVRRHITKASETIADALAPDGTAK